MIELEPKDWLLLVSFSVTLTGAWTRLKYRINRSDELHTVIRASLEKLSDSETSRHTEVTQTLVSIREDVGAIKTDVAVMKNEQVNTNRRLDALEKIG